MALDLKTLKTTMAGIFTTANDTAAAYDLSSGMDNRVSKVLTVNPTRIPIQASFYPCVTLFMSDKQIQDRSMAGNQQSGKRYSELNIKIAGVVWNSSVADPTKDASDDDCEHLMENIEEILRRNETLSGTVTWCYPSAVTYHQVNIDEQANLRAGIMNLKAKVLY